MRKREQKTMHRQKISKSSHQGVGEGRPGSTHLMLPPENVLQFPCQGLGWWQFARLQSQDPDSLKIRITQWKPGYLVKGISRKQTNSKENVSIGVAWPCFLKVTSIQGNFSKTWCGWETVSSYPGQSGNLGLPLSRCRPGWVGAIFLCGIWLQQSSGVEKRSVLPGCLSPEAAYLEKPDSVWCSSSVPTGISGNLSGTQARIYEAERKAGVPTYWSPVVPSQSSLFPLFKTITFKNT